MSYWPAYMAIQNLSLVFANTILGEWLGSPWQMHRVSQVSTLSLFCTVWQGHGFFCNVWRKALIDGQDSAFLGCLLWLIERVDFGWTCLFICLSVLAGHTSGVTGFWTYLFPSPEPGCLTEFFAYSRIFIYLLYRQCPGFLLFTVRGRGESA